MKRDRKLPRDVFIDELSLLIDNNPNIIFMSADLGAKSLDNFREKYPDNFLHVGISEQNMMDLAAGFALEGKNVYTYAMGPFVTLRCFEQIKVALASMNLPVTILGIGVGYSYAPAGPTHYATEDLSCMRSLGNIEIYSPADTLTVKKLVHLTFNKPHLRYIRIDRQYLDDLYDESGFNINDGVIEVRKGESVGIISFGYMVHQAIEVAKQFENEHGIKIGVIDLFKQTPLNDKKLEMIIDSYDSLIVIEEHFLAGGLGSIIAEFMIDKKIVDKKIERMGINQKYFLDNGPREYLHELANIDKKNLKKKIRKFL